MLPQGEGRLGNRFPFLVRRYTSSNSLSYSNLLPHLKSALQLSFFFFAQTHE